MESSDYNINSVAKAFQLVDILSRKNGQMTVQMLAQKLDVSPSNVTRLLQTMQKAGYVEKSPKTNRYILSNKFYVTVCNMLNSNDFISKYEGAAYRVAERLKATVALNSLYRNNSVMLLRITGSGNDRLAGFKAGDMSPAYCSSSGKAMLSLMPREKLKDCIKDWELERFQTNTITDKEKLLEEIEKCRKKGYAEDREERYAGLVSISFAINEFMQPYAFTVIMSAGRSRELFYPKTTEYVAQCLRDV